MELAETVVFPASHQSIRKVRVAVIVFNNAGHLLLCRQNNRPFWVLPGGTLEPGETVMDCGIRELKEETGLDIRIQQLVGLSDFLRPEPPHALDITAYAEFVQEETPLEMASDENLNEMGFFDEAATRALDIKPDYVKALVLKHWSDRHFPTTHYFESTV